MAYASGTPVSIERTRTAIERMLERYGCNQFQSGWSLESQCEHVAFRHGTTSIMLALPMPKADEFCLTPAGRERSKAAAEAFYAAEKKRRWRALLLVIKAKLEAVECGISTLEREFLSDVVLPNGSTLGEWAVPHLLEIQSGRLALPAHEARR